mgnify:CR=1 FL=1|tara:strand:- start:272 stop:805 length:534 start_codon:yes stop_codon:yes gene_type:complete
MYKNKIWFFDNIINLDLQEKIKDLFLSNNFPWYFIPDVTNQKNQQQRPALQHYFVDEKNFTSQHIDLIKPIIDNSCNKINFKYKHIERVKSFLQFSLNLKDYSVDFPHIDSNQNHLVVLYYVLTAYGNTLIYDRDNKTILRSITPKQGSVVIFDGSYFHTAEQPKQGNRCIINCNLT